MFDLILVMFSTIGAIGAIVAIIIGIRTLLKHPFIFFNLFKRTEITIYNGREEEKIALLSAPIGNKKKRFFGDTAKKISVNVLYYAPSKDGKVRPHSNEIPWLYSYGTRIEIEGTLRTRRDIQKALEKHFFNREKLDIPQGRGEHLAVAYGIEKSNKMFLATNPPIELPLPPHQNRWKVMHSYTLALEVAGENLPSSQSRSTVLFAFNWNNFSVPKRVTAIYTPNKIRNFLLSIGIGREKKVLGSDSNQED